MFLKLGVQSTCDLEDCSTELLIVCRSEPSTQIKGASGRNFRRTSSRHSPGLKVEIARGLQEAAMARTAAMKASWATGDGDAGLCLHPYLYTEGGGGFSCS